ncbi:MAG: stage III sporulation protein AE [Lachnospiraceae bacterium]|nr:stage III sporulation protein AE [Lachnospiraceae bacterium]
MDIADLYAQYDFAKLEEETAALFPEWNISFQELFTQIVSGEGMQLLKDIALQFLDKLANEIGGMKYLLVTLLFIGILSAVFTNLTGIFENRQLSDCGFYFTYLILIIFLIRICTQVFQIAKGSLETIVTFMRLFLPTYFLTVGAAGGSVSALGFYQIFMMAVYGVEILLMGFILPIIGCYMILNVVNGIWEEEKLSLMIRLIKKSIRMILKVLITLVSGTGLIQSMITPVIDTAKMELIQKSVSAMPGLGDIAGGAAQILLGSAVLIKNAAGILLLVLLAIICAIPLCKLLVITALLKLSAAMMGIAADKRMTNCTNKIGDGVMMLFQTTLTSFTFFLILVSLVAFTTNRGF